MNKRTVIAVFVSVVVVLSMLFYWMYVADQAVADSSIQTEAEGSQLGVARQILTWSTTDSKIMAEYPQNRIRLALVVLDGDGRHVIAILQDGCICEGDKVAICAIKGYHRRPAANFGAVHVAYLNPDRRPFLRQTVSGL